MKPNQVIVLLATRPDISLLCRRALPSIKAQLRVPSLVLVVFDQRPPTDQERLDIALQLAPLPVRVLHNNLLPGAGDAWNTGITWIARHLPQSYVAILDDDDQWDPDHLQCCWQKAEEHEWPDIVLSGLRVQVNGRQVNKEPVANLSQQDFLVGNPGWQGSNTFVKTDALQDIGGFTPGLVSCNDRDLAIRLLENPLRTLAYTGRFTSTWHCAERADALSAPGSPQKLLGLAQFYDRYQSRMTEQQQHQFFERAAQIFGIQRAQILAIHTTEKTTGKVVNALSSKGP